LRVQVGLGHASRLQVGLEHALTLQVGLEHALTTGYNQSVTGTGS